MLRANPTIFRALIVAMAAPFALASCHQSDTTASGSEPAAAADVRMVIDEAEAALAILALLREGAEPEDEAWKRLFSTEGYVRLKRREESMQRPFPDEAFMAFLRSDEMLGGAAALSAALNDWRKADTQAASRLAQAYLPAGTRIRATLYPVIKPQSNSFVFETSTDPAIFMYLDPNVPHSKLENTLAHELHHIGYASACADDSSETTAEGVKAAMTWAGAFGEGLAMLAAAGGPAVHPHAVSPPGERARWDKDVANVAQDMKRVETFFLDVIEGRLTGEDAIRDVAMGFFGVQGPWYTVGWSMAATIEEVNGRERLLAVMCDPRLLLATYNTAAMQSTASGKPKPLWSEALMTRLGP